MKDFEVVRKWCQKLKIENLPHLTHLPGSCHIYATKIIENIKILVLQSTEPIFICMH